MSNILKFPNRKKSFGGIREAVISDLLAKGFPESIVKEATAIADDLQNTYEKVFTPFELPLSKEVTQEQVSCIQNKLESLRDAYGSLQQEVLSLRMDEVFARHEWEK